MSALALRARRVVRLRPGMLIAALLVAATSAASGLRLADVYPGSGARPAPHLHGQAVWAAGVRPAPGFAGLVDQNGHPFRLAAARGRTVEVAFLDSLCHQACPLEGRALTAAASALPAARRPVIVIVSVDPNDTPASTRAALRSWGLSRGTTAVWLRGNARTLRPVWRAYRIFVSLPAHGDIVHTAALYVLDRRGGERSAYLYPFVPQLVSADLRTLAG